MNKESEGKYKRVNEKKKRNWIQRRKNIRQEKMQPKEN